MRASSAYLVFFEADVSDEEVALYEGLAGCSLFPFMSKKPKRVRSPRQRPPAVWSRFHWGEKRRDRGALDDRSGSSLRSPAQRSPRQPNAMCKPCVEHICKICKPVAAEKVVNIVRD
jgi:hypothetical protein